MPLQTFRTNIKQTILSWRSAHLKWLEWINEEETLNDWQNDAKKKTWAEYPIDATYKVVKFAISPM